MTAPRREERGCLFRLTMLVGVILVVIGLVFPEEDGGLGVVLLTGLGLIGVATVLSLLHVVLSWIRFRSR